MARSIWMQSWSELGETAVRFLRLLGNRASVMLGGSTAISGGRHVANTEQQVSSATTPRTFADLFKQAAQDDATVDADTVKLEADRKQATLDHTTLSEAIKSRGKPVIIVADDGSTAIILTVNPDGTVQATAAELGTTALPNQPAPTTPDQPAPTTPDQPAPAPTTPDQPAPTTPEQPPAPSVEPDPFKEPTKPAPDQPAPNQPAPIPAAG
jgi:hypothetical protein